MVCFNCIFNDGFFRIIWICSFNFNSNGEVVESIISKLFSLFSALQFWLLTKCTKMWDLFSFFQMPLNFCCLLASCLINVTSITGFWNASFTVNKSPTLNGFEIFLIFKFLQSSLQVLLHIWHLFEHGSFKVIYIG